MPCGPKRRKPRVVDKELVVVKKTSVIKEMSGILHRDNKKLPFFTPGYNIVNSSKNLSFEKTEMSGYLACTVLPMDTFS